MVLFMCEGMYLKKITLSYTDAWLPCTLQQSSKRGLIQLAAACHQLPWPYQCTGAILSHHMNPNSSDHLPSTCFFLPNLHVLSSLHDWQLR